VPINWQEHYSDVRRGGAGVVLPSYSWLRERLEELFREYHEHQKRVPSSLIDVNGLGGVAFEVWVAKRLKELGFEDVRGTPATGDQGADLIAKRNGRTIIIQAKRYQGTVGNKAVQEVASAVSFYGGDEGWVITNSTFTPSARALAQKTNVPLFEGRDLDRLSEILRG
jgi:restriction system protein